MTKVGPGASASKQQLAALMLLGDLRATESAASAKSLYDQALQLALAQRDMATEAELRIRLARVLAADGEIEPALQLAERSLALYQSVRDRPHEADTLSLLGTLNRNAGRLPSAIEYHERALALYRALRDRSREAATLLTLSSMDPSQESAAESQQKAIRLLQPSTP